MWRSWRKPSIHDRRRSPTILPSASSCTSGLKDLSVMFNKQQQPLTAAAAHSPKNGAVFHRVQVATLFVARLRHQEQSHPLVLPGGDSRVVVYSTSLGVVRSTFNDCRDVGLILRGFHVAVDERDLSMHSGFLSELRAVLGKREEEVVEEEEEELALPRVFICRRYIGGAEEVRRLHETGELKALVEGIPKSKAGSFCVCGTCGGHRFLLCTVCDGSRKWYAEKGGGFQSCSSCNENGLIRCPSCRHGLP